MPKAIVIEQTGGPEVMRYTDVTVPDPGPGEIRIRHSAIGLNFIDVYFRTGLYPSPDLPFTPGMEAAGVVTAVGPDVTEFAEGDRIAYASPPLGAYAEERIIPADRVVALPDRIDDAQAAAMMLKGMDGPVSAAPYLPRAKGRYHPDSCRCRRCRTDCLPVGETSWRDRHRHGRIAGKGSLGEKPWLRPSDPLSQ